MPSVPVTKMHGTRNDFILVDERTPHLQDYAKFAQLICERHSGVGADGLLLVLPSSRSDVRMRIFNADGSEAEMCGNGIRCLALYIFELDGRRELNVETAGGIVRTAVSGTSDCCAVRVNVGVPRFERDTEFSGETAFVSLGNPHVVVFRNDAQDAISLSNVAGEYASAIPGGTNVHIAVRKGESELSVRHWERGVGPTMACGTGAVAAAVAAIRRGDVKSPVNVVVPGGTLAVEWDGAGEAYLIGPAVRVFDTTFSAA